MTTDPIIDSEDQITPPMSEESDLIESSPVSSQNFEETIQNLQEQLARSQADYSNLVRRSREESAQIGQWTEDKTILKFLPILDNLERSLDHIPSELVENVWVD